MNFLAHYYFDARIGRPHFNFGLLMPDLVRNFIRGGRLPADLIASDHVAVDGIYKGCVQHKDSDRIFHNWSGFTESMELCNDRLKSCPEPFPRYFFHAHILSELVLDKILLNEQPGLADKLYTDFEQIDLTAVRLFLQNHEINNFHDFQLGFDRFMEVRYLTKYMHFTNIVYALGQIGKKMRLQPFTEYQKAFLLEVSEEIESHLRPIIPDLQSALREQV